LCWGQTAWHGSRICAEGRLRVRQSIEHNDEDLRNLPFLDRKAALARLRKTKVGIVLNEHVAEDGPTAFEHACRLGAEGIVSRRVDGTYRSGPCPTWIKGPQSGERGTPGAK